MFILQLSVAVLILVDFEEHLRQLITFCLLKHFPPSDLSHKRCTCSFSSQVLAQGTLLASPPLGLKVLDSVHYSLFFLSSPAPVTTGGPLGLKYCIDKKIRINTCGINIFLLYLLKHDASIFQLSLHILKILKKG